MNELQISGGSCSCQDKIEVFKEIPRKGGEPSRGKRQENSCLAYFT